MVAGGGRGVRDPIPTYCFALVVVRDGERFLLVQEKSGRWYVPAGRVEPGEDFTTAAHRETLEEAGIAVRLSGIVRVEYTPARDFARLRVVFLAEPASDAPPKSRPDGESRRAEWVRLDTIGDYQLRGEEVNDLLRHVARGGPTYPLDVLQPEMMPYGGSAD